MYLAGVRETTGAHAIPRNDTRRRTAVFSTDAPSAGVFRLLLLFALCCIYDVLATDEQVSPVIAKPREADGNPLSFSEGGLAVVCPDRFESGRSPGLE